MRSRKEIDKQLEVGYELFSPLKNDEDSLFKLSVIEFKKIEMEIMLDIRDLLKKKLIEDD